MKHEFDVYAELCKMKKDQFDAYIELYKELSTKKFNRKHHDAYLSCFLRVGAVDDFLTAVEKYAKEKGLKLKKPRKAGKAVK